MLQERTAPPVAAAMADENTPLVRDAWYVAALSSDLVIGTPFARKIAGERVVLYRQSDGTPVALKDRCAHRAFPLSQGTVAGDDIVCGYHGFRYGPDGTCLAVPSQANVPGGFRVAAFPTVEEEPLIWVWVGDPARSAAQPLPSPAWMRAGSGWERATGYLTIRSSYVHMHENLLDLSHIGFLHAKSFGSPDYASAPAETEIGEPEIVVRRTVAPTFLPPVFAEPLGLVNVPAARIVTSTFVSPGLSISAVALRDLSLPEERRVDHHASTAHLLTPIDADSLHYHFLIGRDFAVGDAATSEFLVTSLQAVFLEDQRALEAIADVRRDDAAAGQVDRSVATDKAGIAMRRYLKRLADDETAARARAQA